MFHQEQYAKSPRSDILGLLAEIYVTTKGIEKNYQQRNHINKKDSYPIGGCHLL